MKLELAANPKVCSSDETCSILEEQKAYQEAQNPNYEHQCITTQLRQASNVHSLGSGRFSTVTTRLATLIFT